MSLRLDRGLDLGQILMLGLGGLAGSQDLRRRLGDFGLEFVEFLLDYLLIVREISLQPFESTGVILGLEVTLELIKLFIGHLVSQANTNAHLKRFVDVLKETVLLGFRQAAETDFYQQTVINFKHKTIVSLSFAIVPKW